MYIRLLCILQFRQFASFKSRQCNTAHCSLHCYNVTVLMLIL